MKPVRKKKPARGSRAGTSPQPLGRKPSREEIADLPLLLDEKRYWPWACKRYGTTFMVWVRKNWITASEREIQVMQRAWKAAGGAAD